MPAGSGRDRIGGSGGSVTGMPTDDEFKAFNRNLIDEFRNNQGKVTGIFERAPLLLLTTTGARSGRPFTTPLVYSTDGDRLVVIASKGGAPTSPDWYHNVVAHPKVTIELPGERFEATASIAQGAERDRLYQAQAALMPNFADYERNTTRVIPVVVLERAG